jgi:aminoglycoside phosphotransferase (APT) family kinase protein
LARTHVRRGALRERDPHPRARTRRRRDGGRFTRATHDLTHTFAFTRAGVHDTAAHLAKLERLRAASDEVSLVEARALASEILSHASELPALDGLPLRIVHGDLKASNLLFAHERDEAVCLVDLDTMAHGTVATEMGDALRSWTNPRGEDDARGEVDAAVFSAAVEGYLAEAGDVLGADERACFARGLETIATELASRFCAGRVRGSLLRLEPRPLREPPRAQPRPRALAALAGALGACTSRRARGARRRLTASVGMARRLVVRLTRFSAPC